MYIMTDRGWQRIVTNPFSLGSRSFANDPVVDSGLRLGYTARDMHSRYCELASLVIPEKYNR